VVSLFTDTFWQALRLNGYHPESNLKERVTPALAAFAASSLGERGGVSEGGERKLSCRWSWALPPSFPFRLDNSSSIFPLCLPQVLQVSSPIFLRRVLSACT
jgi:hypothetical protein